MAGIEKVCELTGEYCSHEMYQWKRNQLQVKRECRKLFRKADHILHVYKEDRYLIHKKGGATAFCDGYWLAYSSMYNNEKEFMKDCYKGYTLRNEYTYVLEVTNPALQGEVKGKYMNWTTDLKTVKRKLKRILRCKKLNIVMHDKSYYLTPTA